MTKTVDTSLSLSMQVSEASTSQHRTFTVGFRPAHHFLAGLMILSRLNPTAAMIVKNGEIHLSATSTAFSAYGTMVMVEASTAASWTSNSFAICVDTCNWRTLLSPSVSQQLLESFWIYKIGTSPELYCLVGNDSEPIKLGETIFIEEGGVDLRYLPTHEVTINLSSECLREVITTFSPRFDHVVMMVKYDSIIWRHATEQLIHHQENGDCVIEGVEPGDISYLLIEWRDPRFLNFASWLTDDVHIYNLDDPDWRNWTLLSFIVSEQTSFRYMFRASDSPLLYGL